MRIRLPPLPRVPRRGSDRRRLEVGSRPGGGAPGSPYPSFDVAAEDKWAHDWDEKTRRLVLQRVHDVPPYRFFAPSEARLLEAICARLLPQDDRLPSERVPIAPWIDARLHEGRGDGYRYEDMPDDREAYRRGLAALDRTAVEVRHASFLELSDEQRDALLGEIAQGRVRVEAWEGLAVDRFVRRLMNDVISAYYAHPLAWAEIGFNGPSSPRGHMRLDLGRRDPWEAEESIPRSSVEIVRRAPGGSGGGDVPTH